MASERRRMETDSRKLKARRSSLFNDVAAVEAAFASINERVKIIDEELKQLAQAAESIQAELNDVRERIDKHKSQNRPFLLPDEQAALDAYNKKGADLEAE